ncbi:MAG: hypothetical protein Q8R30_01520 [bacterium]|nr:hypothetical protein [bacterium]MDZ4285417.1 hypothetical protein [Candidatus Sungbacteria bacterium]
MPVMAEPVVLEDNERHLVLYAKGHYRKSRYVLEDLKKIFARFFCIESRFLSDQDVYARVLEVFLKVTSVGSQHLFWERLFYENGKQYRSITPLGMIDRLLGKIAICKVWEDGTALIELGEPDYTILPEPA